MSAVLERCALAGIRLWVEGPALRYDAPKGAMSEELAADIKAHKAELLAALAADDDALWWRIAILEPTGRTIEVDTPSGWTLADWQAYADRYHGPGCTVTPIAGLPKRRAPADLDEVLAADGEGVAGITVKVFRSLLAPEDIKDIEAGAIHRKTLCAYAQSFAEGIRSGRVVVRQGAFIA